MSKYTEIADRLQEPGPGTAEFYEACDKAAAILRSLDAQEPVLTVCKQPDYWHGGHFHEGTRPYIDPFTVYALPIGTKLYAAPVAAQPSSATLLVRDLAASLCVQPLAVCEALKEFGFGNFSVNMAVPADAVKVIESKFAQPQQAKPLSDAQPRLRVRLQSFPESNGKRNWTALLCREDENFDGLVGNCGGIQIARGELWNRVAYHAEEARFLIGERDTEPHILDYGDDIETPEQWAGEVRNGIKEQG